MELKENKHKDFVLFVGEGDFSFTACYTHTNEAQKENVFASCMCKGALSSTQEENIKIIAQNGGSVFTDVDATNLETHPVIGKIQFSKITFNFPHIPKKMNIKENRKLVELFLKSAGKILKEYGAIHVALCCGQGGTAGETVKREWGNTWQVTSLAANAGLVLRDIEPFRTDQFAKYECTGFRGQAKSFHMEGAITHIFCHGKPVLDINQINQCDDLFKWFEQDSRKMYELSSKKSDSPFTRVLLDLHHSAEAVFSSVESIFVPNLLVCKDMDSCPEDKLASNTCCPCMHNILTLFLDNYQPSSSKVYSVVHSLCCASNIDVSKLPFYHFLSYFSSSESLLMESLESLLKPLSEPTDCAASKSCSWFDTKHIFNQVIVDTDQATNFKELKIGAINPIFAVCSPKMSNCSVFYTSVEILTANEEHSELSNAQKIFEIGHIVKFSSSMQNYVASILNLDIIATLRYHITDCRIQLLHDSYFTSKIYENSPTVMFRSLSIFPPSYSHDTSFWISEKFDEKRLFLLVRKTVGGIIESVKLVDSFHDNATNRDSRCYRFIYTSLDKVLSKQTSSNIHSRIMRKAIEYTLQVQLR